MSTNPNEYHMVARERTADRMDEAEQWRQRRAMRPQERTAPETSAVLLGMRRLIRKLRPDRRSELPQPTRSSLSGQRS